MPGSLAIPLLVAIGVFAAIAAFFQYSNARGSKRRARRANDDARSANAAAQRKADIRVLTGPEKRLYAQAKELQREGKIQSAARILEQLNMTREAIQSLEDAGLIHEAAKILMRMGRHNRAGVVYARHGMWLDAATSFKMAQMPLEVAKCAREAERFDLAAEYFEKAGRLDEAAASFELGGELLRAATFYLSAGNRTKSMELFNKLPSTSTDTSTLGSDDVQAIVDYLCEGHRESGLVKIASQHGKLAVVVNHLLVNGKNSQARDVYQQAPTDIGPPLMATVNYHDHSAEALAQLFLTALHFEYAGKVFEHMGSFERAGAAFAEAEDFERSAYCYERAGRDDLARPIRERAERADIPPPPIMRSQKNPGFALSSLPGEDPAANERSNFAPAEGDATALVTLEGAKPPPPTALGSTASGNTSSFATPKPIQPVAPTSAESMAPSPPSNITRKPGSASPPAISEESSPHTPEPSTNTPTLRVVPPLAEVATNRQQTAPTRPNSLPSDPAQAAFHRAKFFSDLETEQKNALWAIGESVDFAEGASVLTYNDEPQGVYIIVSGTVACYRNVDGIETYVDQMAASETFGELWLLADQPTAVRFVAQSATRIRIIGRDAFNSLMDKDGTIARKVYKRFTMRLLKRLLRPQNNPSNQQAS